jgi:DNA-binding response OmpR family regulator
MAKKDLLRNKKILIVDDEPDVLETLKDLLSICDVLKASTFEEAKNSLESEDFDIAILDIMGVDGHKLLEIAKENNVLAVMLTAYALTPEDTVRSYRKGAAHYIPKEKMAEIMVYLNDILEAKAKGKNLWWRWLDRFGSYYDKKFGPDWKDKDSDIWDELRSHI